MTRENQGQRATVTNGRCRWRVVALVVVLVDALVSMPQAHSVMFSDAVPVIVDEQFRDEPSAAQTPSHRNETDRFVMIGQNFTGSTLFRDSGFIPPDTMGAVGNSEFVELINGRYSVYDKSDGTRIQTSSLNQFWTDAGVSFTNFTFDPRVVYDPLSSRWYAASADNSSNENNFLLAVSKTSNPTQGWSGFAIDSDSANLRWADFPTLGFNRDGVYLSANMFPIPDRGAGGELTTTIVAVPKEDLLAPVPTVAGATVFENNRTSATGFTVQPAVDLDNRGLPAVFLSSFNTFGGEFKRSDILGDIRSPILDTSAGIISVTPFLSRFSAEQPGPKLNLEIANGSIFHGNVILQGGALWGVQTVLENGVAALRWFQIDVATNKLLQEGIIARSGLEIYYGSITVNEFGDVVIGFSGSSESQFVSSYAAAGSTVNGKTVFGEPILLREGVATYEQTFGTGRNRWGDYSATTLDPKDPRSFWTIQEWVSSEDIWSTQITQLRFGVIPEPSTFLLLASGLVGLAGFGRNRLSKQKGSDYLLK